MRIVCFIIHRRNYTDFFVPPLVILANTRLRLHRDARREKGDKWRLIKSPVVV